MPRGGATSWNSVLVFPRHLLLAASVGRFPCLQPYGKRKSSFGQSRRRDENDFAHSFSILSLIDRIVHLSAVGSLIQLNRSG